MTATTHWHHRLATDLVSTRSGPRKPRRYACKDAKAGKVQFKAGETRDFARRTKANLPPHAQRSRGPPDHHRGPGVGRPDQDCQLYCKYLPFTLHVVPDFVSEDLETALVPPGIHLGRFLVAVPAACFVLRIQGAVLALIGMSKRSAASAGFEPVVRVDPGPRPSAGTILRVRMINLRCHRHRELHLGPHVNFICGLNGSGEQVHDLNFDYCSHSYPRRQASRRYCSQYPSAWARQFPRARGVLVPGTPSFARGQTPPNPRSSSAMACSNRGDVAIPLQRQ